MNQNSELNISEDFASLLNWIHLL